MKPSNVVALMLVGALSSVAVQAAPIPELTLLPKAVRFEVTCLDCPIRLSLTPAAINASGVVVANTLERHNKAYLLDHGTATVIPNRGGYANAVNDSGLVVGTTTGTWEGNVGAYAYTWDGTTLTLLGDPINVYPQGGYFSKGLAVNASGQVVGEAMADFQLDVAFIYSGGVMTPIEFPGSQNPYATGINSHGRVVGTAPPGYGINNHGWVVGQACLHTDYLDCIAVISDGASTIDLNEHLDPADRSTWFLAKAVGINDAGQIIGTGSFYGNPHAFLATPIKN